MRKIRLVLLGVLCAGLLVCGIGTGVTLAEVSTFSYGGQQLLESAQSRTQSLTVTLDLPECTVYLEDVPYGWGSDNRLRDVSRLEISSDIPAGTLRPDATYDSAGPEPAVRTDFCNRDSLDTVFALNVDDGVAELQRDAEIIQTLYDVSLQTTGVRHQFGNYLDLRAFQRHAACHDQTNVTGT